MWFIILPMIFMLVMPMWAMIHNLFFAPGWLLSDEPNYLLGCIGLATIALEVWMIVEALKAFPQAKGALEVNPLDNWQGREIPSKIET